MPTGFFSLYPRHIEKMKLNAMHKHTYCSQFFGILLQTFHSFALGRFYSPSYIWCYCFCSEMDSKECGWKKEQIRIDWNICKHTREMSENYSKPHKKRQTSKPNYRVKEKLTRFLASWNSIRKTKIRNHFCCNGDWFWCQGLQAKNWPDLCPEALFDRIYQMESITWICQTKRTLGIK